jgi:hypothetical protein
MERPRLLFVERILGWLNRNDATASARAEEFDFYSAEEGLLDS